MFKRVYLQMPIIKHILHGDNVIKIARLANVLSAFGDGGTALGNTVSHAYRFPGEYVVVLNANASDGEAVSRLNVKVITPELSVAKVAEGIQVSNNSKYEVNLGGWIISSDKSKFIIPSDTIILSGKTITFPNEVTGISDESVTLKNPPDNIVTGKQIGRAHV